MPSGRPFKGHGSIGIYGSRTPIPSASTLQLRPFGDSACHCRPVTTYSDDTRRDDLSTQGGKVREAQIGVADTIAERLLRASATFGRLPVSDTSMRLGMVCTAIGAAGRQVWHAKSTPDCGAGWSRLLCQACPSGS